jgi:hypothetical protein
MATEVPVLYFRCPRELRVRGRPGGLCTFDFPGNTLLNSKLIHNQR